MNKTNITYQSQQFLTKEYLEYSKMRSKDKNVYARKYSRSPIQSDQPSKLCAKPETEELKKMQMRYKELQQKYRDLLQKTKLRNTQHDKLKEEIKHYRKMHERDTDDIERLRSIIGLIKKQSVSTQVEEDQLDTSNPNGVSRINKFEQSTLDEIRLKNSGEKFNSKEKTFVYKPSPVKCDQTSNSRISATDLSVSGLYQKVKSKYSTSNGNIASGIDISRLINSREPVQTSKISKKLSNSPYAHRYLYVPGGLK